MRDGNLAIPAAGNFKNGRGEFFNEYTFNGQADNGKTWEINWIADDIRVKK